MANRTGKYVLLLVLAMSIEGERLTAETDHEVMAIANRSAAKSAVDPCEVLRHKKYVRTVTEKEYFSTGLQSLPKGSPFLKVGGLFHYKPYGVCKVTSIVDPNIPFVKAMPMTGKMGKLAKEALAREETSDFDFENSLKQQQFRPILPGSPIGTPVEMPAKYVEGGRLSDMKFEVPPRIATITSEAWQDEESEKFFVNVNYWDDDSTVAVEADKPFILLPGVLIKTIEFPECSTEKRMMNWQGDTSVKVKVTYYSGNKEIHGESTVDLKGRIEKKKSFNSRKNANVPFFSLQLDPVASDGDKTREAVQRGLRMNVDGDSLQEFDYIRTLDLEYKNFRAAPTDSFYPESLS